MPILLMLAADVPAAVASPAPAPASPDYVIGKTTIAEVTAKLGKPGTVYGMADGTKIFTYVSSRTHVKGYSFIPVVGMFAAGAKGSTSIKTFTFGPDGILKNFTSSDTTSNCDVSVVGGGCH